MMQMKNEEKGGKTHRKCWDWVGGRGGRQEQEQEQEQGRIRSRGRNRNGATKPTHNH